MIRPAPTSTLFPYTTLFRSRRSRSHPHEHGAVRGPGADAGHEDAVAGLHPPGAEKPVEPGRDRSEEHTSELQSRRDLVCRLLLEKKIVARPAAANPHVDGEL